MGQVLHTDDPRSFRGIRGMDQLGIVASRLKPGAHGAAHSHTEVEETTVVRSGTGQIQIEDRLFELCPGSVAVVPAGQFHCITNTGTDDLEMVTVFNASYERDKVVVKSREQHFGAAASALPATEIGALRESIDALRRELATLRG